MKVAIVQIFCYFSLRKSAKRIPVVTPKNRGRLGQAVFLNAEYQVFGYSIKPVQSQCL